MLFCELSEADIFVQVGSNMMSKLMKLGNNVMHFLDG